MSFFLSASTRFHSQNYRIYSQRCAASIAVLHGDAGRFVKAVKAEKSNETL
jgi:hypothetical protein